MVNKLRRRAFFDEKTLVWGFFCGVLGVFGLFLYRYVVFWGSIFTLIMPAALGINTNSGF